MVETFDMATVEGTLSCDGARLTTTLQRFQGGLPRRAWGVQREDTVPQQCPSVLPAERERFATL